MQTRLKINHNAGKNNCPKQNRPERSRSDHS